MELKSLPHPFSVCQVPDFSQIDRHAPFTFTAHTDQECSLVCPTAAVPAHTLSREDGWRGFRIQGVLSFDLIGVLSPLSTLLADAHIGLFAISTYNTDYIFTKQADFPRALTLLAAAGYTLLP